MIALDNKSVGEKFPTLTMGVLVSECLMIAQLNNGGATS
jgi:hypothetical protein